MHWLGCRTRSVNFTGSAISAALAASALMASCAAPPRQCEDKPARTAPWLAACTAVGSGFGPPRVSAHDAGPADIPRRPGNPAGTTEPVCATPEGRCVVRFDQVAPLGTACYCTVSGRRVPGLTASGWNP